MAQSPPWYFVFIVGIILATINYNVHNTFGVNAVKLNSFRNNEFAQSFGDSMDSTLSTFSGYDVMQGIYDFRFAHREFSIHKLNGTKLIKSFARDLEKMLHRREGAVQRSVAAGEKAAQSFNWTAEPNTTYVNIQYVNTDTPLYSEDDDYAMLKRSLNFKQNGRFQRDVNLNQSIVQVPFNVYCQGKKLLKSVQWSKALNKQFIENGKRDPSLKWQYFGSVEGYLRIYPGFQWVIQKPNGQPNIYDSRTQIWYTQSATYPKDMLILLDRSGSMTGLKISIAVDAVKTLLDTLGDDDFFNVLTFSGEAEAVEPCFNETLVRADIGNKESVLRRLENIETRNIAVFDEAFKKALDMMARFHSGGGGGSGCNCAIMLITDGAPENYQWIFDQVANRSDSFHFRVFAYLVGQEKDYMEPVKEMACKNNGYFTQVESPNSVTEQVLHHVGVLNRPLAFRRDHHTVWTKAYYDRTNVGEDYTLVSTVATPVYRMNVSGLPPTMLGIMATDIPIEDMLDSMPINRIGVNAFVYMITNNGYVMFHPRLRSNYMDEYGKIRIKPMYNSYDIDTLETGLVHELVRSEMVRGGIGSTNSPQIITILDDWTRVLVTPGTYYYLPISNTPFSLALVLPKEYGHTRVNYSDDLTKKRYDAIYNEEYCNKIQKLLMKTNSIGINRLSAICSLTLSNITVAERWLYCSAKDKNSDVAKLSQLEMLILYALGRDNDTLKCNDELLDSLLFDVYLSAALPSVWSEYIKYRNTSTIEGIEMMFVIGKSGMVRQCWHGEGQDIYNSTTQEMFKFTRYSFPNMYRRAVSLPPNTWLYTLPLTPVTLLSDRVILAAKAVRQNNAILAVSGVLMKFDKFRQKFWDRAFQTYDVNCMDVMEEVEYECYVVDENAMIILARNNKLIGKFFGSVEGGVMRHLEAAFVFNRVQLVDYQAMCLQMSDDSFPTNSGQKLLNKPITTTIGYVVWWISEFSRLVLNLAVYKWLPYFFTAPAAAQDYITADNFRPCHQRYDVFVANRSKTPYVNNTMCEGGYSGCNRDVGVYNISKTNLYLIVSQQLNVNFDCSCNGTNEPLKLEKGVKIKYKKKQICERLIEHKERRRPSGCVNNDKGEIDMKLPCTSSPSYLRSSSNRVMSSLILRSQTRNFKTRTFFSAWVSCITTHMLIVAVCALFSDDILFIIPTVHLSI